MKMCCKMHSFRYIKGNICIWHMTYAICTCTVQRKVAGARCIKSFIIPLLLMKTRSLDAWLFPPYYYYYCCFCCYIILFYIYFPQIVAKTETFCKIYYLMYSLESLITWTAHLIIFPDLWLFYNIFIRPITQTLLLLALSLTFCLVHLKWLFPN